MKKHSHARRLGDGLPGCVDIGVEIAETVPAPQRTPVVNVWTNGAEGDTSPTPADPGEGGGARTIFWIYWQSKTASKEEVWRN